MDVLIVGGGVIGMTTALSLTSTGARITIVDQGEFGKESTWAGGGILSPLYPWHYSDNVHQLAKNSKAGYEQLAQTLQGEVGLDIELVPCGLLMLNTPAQQAKAQAWYAQHPHAYIPPTPIDAVQAVQLNPQINPKLLESKAYLWDKNIAHVRNPRLAKALYAVLKKRGVQLVANTKIEQFKHAQTGNITAVIDQHGTSWQADKFVICSGAWSGLLANTLNINIDVKPILGQMLLFKTNASWLPTMLMQDGVYLIPRKDGHLLCGSTLEDVGFDKTINPQSTAHLQQRAFEMIPALQHIPLVKIWTGLRPASPDNIPYIEQSKTHPNLWINAGHFRYGIVFALNAAERLKGLMGFT